MWKEIKKEAVKPVVQAAPAKDYSTAKAIAVKLIKMFEGCNLHAYPDPASELYAQLSRRNILRKWVSGDVTEIPKDLQKVSGGAWTIGYGETLNVKQGDVWTQEQADKVLSERVTGFLEGVLKACPALAAESPERIASCVSLAYNIGLTAFAKSTVVKKANEGDWHAAGDATLMWNKAGGVVIEGLNKRRKIERDVFMSVGV